MNKLKKIVGYYKFSEQFIKKSHYKMIGYIINVLQQTACLVVKPITVGKFAKLLKQGYRYHKIRKAFSTFYHKHSELIVEYNIGL